MKYRSLVTSALAAALLLLASSVSEQSIGLAQTPQAGEWERFVATFLEESFAADPPFAVWAGRHEYDGRLPDLTAEGLAAELRRVRTAREQALSFDSEGLGEAQRFEREYLLTMLDGEIFWRAEADWPRRNPMFYARPLSPDIYLTREYAPLVERMEAYVRYARNLPAALEQIRRNLRTPMPRTYVETAHGIFSGMLTLFSEMVPRIFADVEDASLRAAFAEANQGAMEAARAMAAWVDEQREDATDDYALGAELYRAMLRQTERVDVRLEELEAIGRQDLERNLAALREACASYTPEEPISRCIEKASSNKPREGAVEGARQQLAGLKTFLIDHDVVSIPGDEEARVDEAPPHRRWNSAYINVPGPYEQGLPSIYYIAPPDPDWSEEERRGYIPGEADLLFITVHEVWPGHFLHFLHAKHSASTVGRLFRSYAFTEGWAHYAEELMWEAGLGSGNPELHVGQLTNALLRNVRFLSSIGLHTEGMRVEDSERMFMEYAYQDPGNARQQAARGTFDPGYLNYTLGKLMIRQLRDDWTASRGGRRAWRAFHDQLLSYGGPPIPLVRAAMLGSTAGPLLSEETRR